MFAHLEAPFAALSAAFNAAEPDGGEAGSARALVQLAARMARQREVRRGWLFQVEGGWKWMDMDRISEGSQ